MGACADLYTPPDVVTSSGILGRFRRPVYGPLAGCYVEAWSAPGDLVLDPFCQDASVLRAAISAERRALAVTGNPLLALLVRVEAAPPPADALRAALHRLQGVPKLDLPLGAHLDGLYATACSRCRTPVPADAYTWERGTGQPVLRDYSCPQCGHTAREPVPPEEVARHLSHDPQGFHRRLVAERLRTDGAPRRLQRRLLDLYTPRNVYALTSLLLKVELLFTAGPVLDALRAAFLHTLDVASRLNQVVEGGWRPVRSLQPPRQYREANVWRTFVRAVEGIAAAPAAPRLALAATPEQAVAASAQGPAYVGLEPLPRLAQRLAGIPHFAAVVKGQSGGTPLAGQVSLALAQLPRFDPTFAALSYLWSGWLLGKEGSRAAVRLLSQRSREDAPYQRALRSFLGVVAPALSPQGRLALVFQAPATRYLEELLLAAAQAGLPVIHAWHGALEDGPAPPFGARRAEHHIVLGRPVAAPLPASEGPGLAGHLAARTAARVLEQRAEPAAFTVLHGPIWAALAQAGLHTPAGGEMEEHRRHLEEAVAHGLEGHPELLQPSPAPGGEEVTWWLSQPPAGAPLADRVEQVVAQALRPGQSLAEQALWAEIATRFPPPQTPSWPLVLACLASYGEPVGGGGWALAAEEGAAAATVRREHLLAGLVRLGKELQFHVGAPPAGRQLALGCCPTGDTPTMDLEWMDGGEAVYGFVLRQAAASADLRAMPSPTAGRRILVIPERRVELWRHKLAAAPLWAAQLERAGWGFLRQGNLEHLLNQPVSREAFAAALGLAEPGGQLSLFNT